MKALTSIIQLALAVSSISAQIVEIPDPELQAVVRKALGKSEGDITAKDMESLVDLDASIWSRGLFNVSPITSLHGLQYAKNLVTLDLAGDPYLTGTSDLSSTEIDWSVLEGLTNLQSLELMRNSIPPEFDFSFLQGLANLQDLGLSFNDLDSETDFSPLESLTNLRRLDLNGNCLTSGTGISFLQSLTNLQSLHLKFACLTTLSFLEGMSNLRGLYLGGNSLTSETDFSFLSGFRNFKSLDVGENNIRILTLPEGTETLSGLFIDQNPMEIIRFPLGFDLESLLINGKSPFDSEYAAIEFLFYVPFYARVVGNNLELSWSQGVLQSTDALEGPWADVPGATSPYVVDPIRPQQFFRAIAQSQAGNPTP